MKKHIVHVHEKFYPFMGGSTHRLLNLLMGIDLNEFEITVLCENSENIEIQNQYKGINIYRFNTYKEIPSILKMVNEKQKIDLIHAHNFRPSFFAYRTTKKYLKVPFIMEMHAIYDTSKIKALLGKYLLNRAEGIILLSNSSETLLKKMYNVKNNNIDIIYNGINLKPTLEFNEQLFKESKVEDVFNFISQAKNNSDILMSYIGSLDAFQGIDNLVEIINGVNNKKVKFLVIGGNEEESKQLLSKLNNPNVIVKPFINSRCVYPIYSQSNALLVPRPSMLSTESAVPLKPLEAIVNKCAVLSTKVGGMLELKEVSGTKNIHFYNNISEMTTYLNNLQAAFEFVEEDTSDILKNFKDINQSMKLAKMYDKYLN